MLFGVHPGSFGVDSLLHFLHLLLLNVPVGFIGLGVVETGQYISLSPHNVSCYTAVNNAQIFQKFGQKLSLPDLNFATERRSKSSQRNNFYPIFILQM